MPPIAFPELKELDGKIAERRSKLRSIFDEAGPTLDMDSVKSLDGDSTAKTEAIRSLNDEIDDLCKSAEEKRMLLKAAGQAYDSGDVEHVRGGTKSITEQFLESKAYTGRGGDVGPESELDVDLKTLMSTSAGWAPTPERRNTLIDSAQRPIELVDLIPVGGTTSGSLTYWEETTFTNGATETAEGDAMPEGAIATTERTANVRKIPVLLPVTDEQLEDELRVQSLIETRLPFMVRQRLSLQIAAGDGSAPNLRGILNVSGIQTQAKGSDPVPDAVYKAIVKVETTGQAMPDAYVTNPLDWQDVRLLRTSDGIYIWGNPSEAGPERIWGLRVVRAQAMTQNTGVVGDFANFSELAVRKGMTVDVGLINDDFGKGRQTFRAQMRAALIWYRPAAFCTVTSI